MADDNWERALPPDEWIDLKELAAIAGQEATVIDTWLMQRKLPGPHWYNLAPEGERARWAHRWRRREMERKIAELRYRIAQG